MHVSLACQMKMTFLYTTFGFSDREMQEEEINGLQTTKTRMKLKISELEQTMKK